MAREFFISLVRPPIVSTKRAFNNEATPCTGFMLSNYIVGYLRYPSRVWRSVRNIIRSDSISATVFEHRVKDALRGAGVRG